MQKILLTSLLVVLISQFGIASKNHYDIFKEQFVQEFIKEYDRKPDLQVSGNVFSATINYDYIRYVDAMRTYLEDMKINADKNLEIKIYGDTGISTDDNFEVKAGLRGEFQLY